MDSGVRTIGPINPVANAPVDMGGDAQLTFDGYGLPDTGGFVIVQAGDYQYTVVVDPETGAAEVQ